MEKLIMIKKLSVLILILAAFVLGVFFDGYIYCVTCGAENFIDINNDGERDYLEKYSGKFLSETQEDRNFDSEYDVITTFTDGYLDSAILDNDFNGTFETHLKYFMGQPQKLFVDLDEDKKIDATISFKDGVIKEFSIINSETGTVLYSEDYYFDLTMTQYNKFKEIRNQLK